MTIFRKVFDSKKSNSVPAYFERVATPDDISTDPAYPERSQPLAAPEPSASETPISHPLASQPLTSRPHMSEPARSEPAAHTLDTAEQIATPQPVVSQPVVSHPVASQPLTSQPFAAQAGPEKVTGPIFGIGHTEDPLPLTPADTGADGGQDPDLAAMAAEAFQRMQTPARPSEALPQMQSAPTSVPRMLSTPEADAPGSPATSQPGGAARTRLLGFHRSQPVIADPLGDDAPPKVFQESLFPAGWVAIIGGPGEGNALPVFGRVCQIGRGEDQDIRLDFGDTSISRDRHAAIAFDDEQRKFYLGHGGKSNLIRLNGRPVLSTEELSHGDTIRIGETTLRFAALCGEDFTWNGSQNDHA